MDAQKLESCENCGRQIGKLETPHVFQEYIVCAECKQRLMPGIGYESTVQSPAVETPETVKIIREVIVGPGPCPNCGSIVPAEKRERLNAFLLILLLLVGILPGLIYLTCSGYSYVCPSCGFKRGDAV